MKKGLSWLVSASVILSALYLLGVAPLLRLRV
jgi:hypothetical protein